MHQRHHLAVLALALLPLAGATRTVALVMNTPGIASRGGRGGYRRASSRRPRDVPVSRKLVSKLVALRTTPSAPVDATALARTIRPYELEGNLLIDVLVGLKERGRWQLMHALAQMIEAEAGPPPRAKRWRREAERPDGPSSWAGARRCRSADKPDDLAPPLPTRLRIDTIHYNILIGACLKPGRWKEAMALLRRMGDRGVERDTVTYNALLGVMERARKPRLARKILSQMRNEDVPPNTITFTSAISCFAKGGEWTRALALLARMRDARVPPNTITYTAAISACERGGQWERAVGLLARMEAEGVEPDRIVLNAAISACARCGQAEAVRTLIEVDAPRLGITADAVSYTGLVRAHANADPPDPVAARAVVDQAMAAQGLSPDIFAYNSLLDAHARAAELQPALDLLQTLRAGGGAADPADGEAERTLELFNQMRAEADEKGGKVDADEARERLRAMRADAAGVPSDARPVVADVISYTTAVSACAYAEAPDEAMRVLDMMRADGVAPATLTYSRAIAAVLTDAGADACERACALFERISAEGLHHNYVTTNMVLGACATCRLADRGLTLLTPIIEGALESGYAIPANATTATIARELLAIGGADGSVVGEAATRAEALLEEVDAQAKAEASRAAAAERYAAEVADEIAELDAEIEAAAKNKIAPDAE